MEGEPAVAAVSLGERYPSGEKANGAGDEDTIPTPAATTNGSKVSVRDNNEVGVMDPGDDSDVSDLSETSERPGESDRDAEDRQEAREAGVNAPSYQGAETATTSEIVEPIAASKYRHSRHPSRQTHSRNPSDVCPRVAVIATQEEEENVCSICLDEFSDEDPAAETQCGHGYHLQCIMQWAQRSQECPLCFSELVLADEDMNSLLPFGEYSSPENERAMSNMLANMEFESFLIHLAAAERRHERQQRRESRRREQERVSSPDDGGHVVMTAGGSADGGSGGESPAESTLLKTVRRGFASFFLGK